MKEISTKSMDLLCRTCMTSESNFEDAKTNIMISIYDTIGGLDCPNEVFSEDLKIIILDLIKITCPQLEIEYNDNLPAFICKICKQKLLELYKFQQNALRVENELREMIACDTMDPLIENMAGIPVESTLLKIEIMEPLIDFENYENNEIKSPLTDTPNAEWPNEDDAIKVGEVSSKTVKSEGNSVIKVQQKFPCDECDSKLSSLNNLKRHKLIHVKNAEEDSIRNKDKVNSEEIELKSEENQCKISEKEIVTIQENENAYSSQPSDEELKSQEIDKSNLIEKAVTGDINNEHNNQTTSDKPVACDICGKTLSCRRSLTRHIKILHSNGKKKTKPKHECEYCQKVFKKPYKLIEHKRNHTGESPYLCSECGRSFKTFNNLRQHLKRHGTEKPYECPHCPLKFSNISGLCSHKALHTQAKKHICDICGRGFYQAHQLKNHNMYHTGEKPHKCKFCEKSFVNGEHCRRHMRTHTGEKPYKCKFCERAFAQSNDLMKHMRTHLGDNVYRCNLCPSRFPLYSELRSHFIAHKNDDDETRANNLKALQEDEARIHKKFGLVSSLL